VQKNPLQTWSLEAGLLVTVDSEISELESKVLLAGHAVNLLAKLLLVSIDAVNKSIPALRSRVWRP
jgi:hypothetical protein